MLYRDNDYHLVIKCFSIFVFIVWHFIFVSTSGGKYETMLVDNAYKVAMKLLVKAVGPSDFGSYKCVAKNSLGETDGTIKLYSKWMMIIPLLS